MIQRKEGRNGVTWLSFCLFFFGKQYAIGRYKQLQRIDNYIPPIFKKINWILKNDVQIYFNSKTCFPLKALSF